MTEFDYATDYDTTSVLKQAAAAFKANPYVQDESVEPWMDGFDTTSRCAMGRVSNQ